jgi:hypothetical protein
MIALQIIIYGILAIGIIALSAKNLSKWAAALQKGYSRDTKRAFGDGWFNSPSLLVCKIHVIFLIILSLLIVFYLCFGTVYL